MDFFNDRVKERSESIVREMGSSIDADRVVVCNFTPTEDALLESTLKVILLILELFPYLSREVLCK
jgi:hypothetical protein